MKEQPARALRNARDHRKEGGGGNPLHAQHPAPVEQEVLGEDEVGEKGDQDAEDDLELIESDEPATDPGGRNLRYVGRHDDRGDPHPQAADEAHHREEARTRGAGAAGGRREVEEPHGEERAAATEAIARNVSE